MNPQLNEENTPITEDLTFWDFGLHPLVEDGIEAMRYEKPSPVQSATIPVILQGKDLIACAQTGTGKTAAYLLPLLSELATGDYPDDYVNALVMAPTRELAMQIEQQIDAFSYFTNTSSVSIYGGTGGVEWEQQKRALKLGADIIVATPGRLLAHLSMSGVDFSRSSFFVLDEADRMLDMGFYDDILEIYRQLPKDTQVIMFSATMPAKIRQLAKEIMKDPVEVNIAISRPPESIVQKVVYCTGEDKMPILTQILLREKPEKGIIFFASKERVKQAKRELRMQGLKVQEMHSDLDQAARNEVMHDFKSGKTNIIVATDILSRGIDVDDIDVVVNFDVPGDPEDYVHRIGRTSRGKNLHGAALTFVSPRDRERFDRIEQFLGYKVKEDEEFSKGKGAKTEKDRGKRSFQRKKEGQNKPETDGKPRNKKRRYSRNKSNKPKNTTESE
ncbi:MAG: DEAD/DEAH box helicase [Porphyromonas sp.]|nr:DEAD/DEAH box helicase [Bacteroidales bacterium]MDY3101058.1 DEAD/DEAH box helicase [Porphyromonas sp.]